MRENGNFRMNPENLLKGRMAETLVDELLRSAGNKVYRFGYEAVLQNLTQIDPGFDRKSEIGQQISSIPDFLVLNQSGQPFFVEVKFRTDPKWKYDYGVRLLKKIERFWKAKVIMVTLQKPYFRIANPPYFDEKNEPRFEELGRDQDLNVTGIELEKFSPLVENYFMSSSLASGSLRGTSKIAVGT